MILRGYFRSSTSYRLRIALNLKGLDYQRSPVNLLTGENKEDEFKRLNPFGTVPALINGDDVLVQSLAILEWLENTYTNPSFLPTNLKAAQICRELYFAVASDIHAINNLPALKYLKSEFNADQAALEKWNATWIHRTFEPIEARLRDFDWLSPDLPFGYPTLFEIVLIPQVYNARRWNTDLSNYPLLTKIDAICGDMDAFKNAHPSQQSDAPGET